MLTHQSSKVAIGVAVYSVIILLSFSSTISRAAEKSNSEKPKITIKIKKDGTLDAKFLHEQLVKLFSEKNVKGEYELGLNVDELGRDDNYLLYVGLEKEIEDQETKPSKPLIWKPFTVQPDSFYYEVVKLRPEYEIERLEKIHTAAKDLKSAFDKLSSKNGDKLGQYFRLRSLLNNLFDLAYKRTIEVVFTPEELINEPSKEEWLKKLNSLKKDEPQEMKKLESIKDVLDKIFVDFKPPKQTIHDAIDAAKKTMADFEKDPSWEASWNNFKQALALSGLTELQKLAKVLPDKKLYLENLTAIINLVDKTQTENLELKDIDNWQEKRLTLLETINKRKENIEKLSKQIERQFEIDELLYRGVLITTMDRTANHFFKKRKRNIALTWDANNPAFKPNKPFETTLLDVIFTVVENAKAKYDVKPVANEIKEDYQVITEALVGKTQYAHYEETGKKLEHNFIFSRSLFQPNVSSFVYSLHPPNDNPLHELNEMIQFLETSKTFNESYLISRNVDSYKPRRDRTPAYFTAVNKIVEITRAPVLVDLTLTSAVDSKSELKTSFRINRTRAIALKLGIIHSLSDQSIVTRTGEKTFDKTKKNRDRGIDPIAGLHIFWRRHDARHKDYVDYIPSPLVAFNLRSLQDNIYLGLATEWKGLTLATGLNYFRTDVADEVNDRIRKTYKRGYFVAISVEPALFTELFKPALGLK